jgi:transposase
MGKKRTYQAASVQQVRVAELLPLLMVGCVVALDVAKQKFVVAVATLAGEVVKLFRFEHPTDTASFLDVVKALKIGVEGGRVIAAMEPTGTYGDAIRHQLVGLGVPVRMVSPKRTHDSQELFDGVRSLHDPKSAMLIAKLHAMGLSTPWSAPPETRLRLRALVDQRRHEQQREEVCFGRLEASTARHWPELGRWMDVRTQRSALTLLTKYPNPARVTEAPEKVRAVLREASRSRLSQEAIDGVIVDARATYGVPMVSEEEQLVRRLATEALEAGRAQDALEASMEAIEKDDPELAKLSTWMGIYTAAVIVTHVDPRQYTSARQLEKACGLNLREKSSGEHTGRLTITKRGPGVVRQVMYLFALRMIQRSPAVDAWYRRRRGYTEESKQRAIVAVMRKLVRALFHVAKGQAFDETKLFDIRRLRLDPNAQTAAQPKQPAPRTTPRSIARGRRRGPVQSAPAAPA